MFETILAKIQKFAIRVRVILEVALIALARKVILLRAANNFSRIISILLEV